MQSYLKLTYKTSDERPTDEDLNCDFTYRMIPFRSSEVLSCLIHDVKTLVIEGDREVFELRLSLDNISHEFEPGSTIAILPSNDEKLVNELIIRLGLEQSADCQFELNISSSTSKKKSSIPKHIPAKCTLKKLFLHYVDLNSVPKKLFLKSLLNFVQDVEERKQLEILCSPKGSEDYTKFISSHSRRSLLGILNEFPSCHPPVEILIEFLPPLLPRPYSVSSSPLIEKYLSITFNIDTFENNQKGVCCNWLEKNIQIFSEKKKISIPFYFRAPSNFKLPSSEFEPIIMVATGTGIAPFKGFLEHRFLLKTNIRTNIRFGDAWLFYGCRNNRNYLYKQEMKNYLESGVLNRLLVSFSRECNEKKCYVQDNIQKYGEELSSLIVESGATVYICGDFSKVVCGVRKTFISILMKFRDFTEETANNYIRDMEKNHKYIVDSWN